MCKVWKGLDQAEIFVQLMAFCATFLVNSECKQVPMLARKAMRLTSFHLQCNTSLLVNPKRYLDPAEPAFCSHDVHLCGRYLWNLVPHGVSSLPSEPLQFGV